MLKERNIYLKRFIDIYLEREIYIEKQIFRKKR